MLKKTFNSKNLLLVLAITLIITADTSCNVDSDCSIKTIECGCCATSISCVNTNWKLDCPEPDYKYNSHPCEAFSCAPPTPPWFDNCQCINNTCTNCRGDDCKTE